MKRLLIIILAAGLVAAAPAFDGQAAPMAAAAEAPPPDEFAGPSNAALVYYRAWLVADGAAWEAVVREDDPARLADLGPAIDHLLAAAAIGACDWGIDYDAGPFALLPHLSKLRDSGRLLKADARRLAASGDMDGAIERLEAMFRMSHHTRRDRMIISSLVGAAISNHACEATDEIVGARPITPVQARRLLAAAELAEDPFAVRAAIRAEGLAFAAWAKENLTGRDAGAQLATIVAGPQLEDDHPIFQMTGDEVGRELDRMAPFYEAAVARFEGPDSASRLLELEGQLQNGAFGAIAKLLAPSILKVRQAMDSAVRKRQEIITKLRMAAER